MKKEYINPAMEIVKMETAQMIATSVNMIPDNATESGMSREFDDTFDLW